MGEYIDRKAAMEIVKRTSGDYAAAWTEIRKLPAADVAPVRHGKWTYNDAYVLWAERYFCSECGRNTPPDGDYRYHFTDYCPNCGAKMDGGTDNDCG